MCWAAGPVPVGEMISAISGDPVVLETGQDIIQLWGVSGGSLFVVHPDKGPPDG
ncbi:hypothetical protein Pmi06nite_09950 [Planotetraspora mira]|uniref:Uncharacterized protein n=1 Tax=Planotetraspora mira TaxID=58121 RepID=A0A8J3TJF5_9ACTN|nr:hypothetical protein Pmi06nite_09950 [Planotetraspora mira]